jgi:hypothetical protein
MNWQEVCEDKSLIDLPYKIELNRWGQIVMSPADYQHSSFQGEILAGSINSCRMEEHTRMCGGDR